jgi:hypothetical protein
MDEELKAIVDRMVAAGESDDNIGLVIQNYKPAESGMSRFVEGVKRNANPITIFSSLKDAVMHPMRTLEGMEQQANEHFTEAGEQWDKGDYGHSVMHGIAGAVPPFGIVTHAGDEIRKGNTAGALGEATGAALAAKMPAMVKKAPAAASATLRGANKVAVAGADMLENNPALATVVGAGVGYAQGGIPGAITGATGGGLVSRIIKALDRGKTAPAAPAVPPVAPPRVPQTTNLLTEGARPMPAGPDPSFVRSVPATYGEPMSPGVIDAPPVASPAPSAPGIVAPSTPTNLPNFSKVDIARISALDKELGAANAARALRHDPRFASMSAAQRTEVVRSVTQGSAPGALPAAAAAAIDAKFAEINPLMRAQYVESWKDVNPAVYAYLRQKVQ